MVIKVMTRQCTWISSDVVPRGLKPFPIYSCFERISGGRIRFSPENSVHDRRWSNKQCIVKNCKRYLGISLPYISDHIV